MSQPSLDQGLGGLGAIPSLEMMESEVGMVACQFLFENGGRDTSVVLTA